MNPVSARTQRAPPFELSERRAFRSADPLAGDTKLDGELVEGDRRIDEPAPFEDVTFAVIENRKRHAKAPFGGLPTRRFRRDAIPGRDFAPSAGLATRPSRPRRSSAH